MLTNLLTIPLKLMPQPATAVSLSIVLNIFFSRYPDLKKQLSELSGKIFEFGVDDLDESFYMMVDDQGGVTIHTYCDNIPNVTMSGTSSAFLSLLFQTADPDSLFFSRALDLSGETDTGLHFKNILNNVDIDWERELATLFSAPVARTLMSLARQVEGIGGQGKEKVESEIEDWMEEHNLPLKAKFETFQSHLEALQEQTDRLEKSISRVGKKLTLPKPKVAAKEKVAAKPKVAAKEKVAAKPKTTRKPTET
jgi:O2-independent ubiquinone biosynthesis accessory factor UbiT